MKFFNKIVIVSLFTALFQGQLSGQCPTLAQVNNQLQDIETRNAEAAVQWKELELIEKKVQACKLPVDSVLARLYHRVGLMQYNMLNFSKAIEYTKQAASINSSGKAGSKPVMAIKSYRNLGLYYKRLVQYPQAITYFDSACMLAEKNNLLNEDYFKAAKDKLDILYETGDYQKCIEWASRSLLKAKANSFNGIERFYTIRAQAYMHQGLFEPALSDVNQIMDWAIKNGDANEQANSIHLKALIYEASDQTQKALQFFKETLALKHEHGLSNTNEHLNLAGFYLMTLKEMPKAKFHYEQALKNALAGQQFSSAIDACNGLAAHLFKTGNPLKALSLNRKAQEYLSIPQPDSIWQNPTMSQLNSIQKGDLPLYLFGNKTEQLLGLYAISKQKKHLDACLQTAMLTDSVITQMRHTQFGEQSKLYWRKRTREFYTHAIEACWRAQNTRLAFYFMEKSKAILLTDKLKELGSQAFLPPAEAAKDQALRIAVFEEEQKLAEMQISERDYYDQYLAWLEAKNQREIFIKTLEKNHPAYYWYKYNDQVTTPDKLKEKMKENNQQFVHYFLTDTALYMLQLSAVGEKMHKINATGLTQLIQAFASQSATNPSQNIDYVNFTRTAFRLYQILFAPLKSELSRTIICPDQFLIPFEAFCIDSAGNRFLVHDHVFQYAYSAGYWLMEHGKKTIRGDFLGVAPAKFANYLNLAPLAGSLQAQQEISELYASPKLLAGKSATRKQFFKLASQYAVLNVFAHARADSLLKEPVLYLADSMIGLSELQRLENPGCQLVILSACQTNVGKLAEGEGIYSLARGFASAGIPATMATLWNADEKATYEITGYFHQYLAAGMPEDSALQQAKLQFLSKAGLKHKLPHFWANYVLMGHSAPLILAQPRNTTKKVAIFASLLAASGLLFYGLYRLKKRKAA